MMRAASNSAPMMSAPVGTPAPLSVVRPPRPVAVVQPPAVPAPVPWHLSQSVPVKFIFIFLFSCIN